MKPLTALGGRGEDEKSYEGNDSPESKDPTRGSALDDVEAALNDNATEEQKQRALAVLPILAKLGQWGKQSFVPIGNTDVGDARAGEHAEDNGRVYQ